jgi:hypothetical protein
MYSSPLEVATLLDTRGFKRCINLRGVYWTNDKNLTSEQMYAISFITDPTQIGTLRARLSKIGITYAKWKGWMSNGVFRNAFNTVASQLLEDNFHEVDRGLLKSASNGDVTAIKFAYEITGRYDPAKKQALDVASVLAQVVEIICKHVKDPAALQAIGGELTMLSGSQGIRTDLAAPRPAYIAMEPVREPTPWTAENEPFYKITPLEGEIFNGNADN